MKFTLAALLLGQTMVVPVLPKSYSPFMARGRALRFSTKIRTDTSPRSSILEPDIIRRDLRRNQHLIHKVMARNLKNPRISLKTIMPCDPKSSDPDIGILSCGKDHACQPSITSSLGGVCTPLEEQELGRDSILPWKGPLLKHHPSVKRALTTVVQCDPIFTDIGILVCEEGQFCENDETSELGGFCVDSLTYNNRRLETYYWKDYIFHCGSWPAENPYGSCDCTAVNMTTGTGTMYCSQNISALLVQGCDEYVVYDFFSYSFNDSVMVKASECYQTITPYTEKVCVFYDMQETESPCHAEWNDQPCNACIITNYYSHGFDCSNVDGGRVGDARKELLTVFEHCSNSTCTNLCGDGSFIPDFNFNIKVTISGYNSTCGALAFYEENEALADAACHYFVQAAQSGGCCVTRNSTNSGGDSPLPGSEPENDSSIPVEDDEDEYTSSPPGDDAVNDGDSAHQTIASFASMTSQAGVIMVLVNRF